MNEFDLEVEDRGLVAVDWTPETGYGNAPKRKVIPRRGAGIFLVRYILKMFKLESNIF